VLDYNNSELRYLLNEFQKHPTLTAFGEYNVKMLGNALSPYLERLSLWVLGGRYGIGDPATQWADYILTCDENTLTLSLYRIEEYYQKLLLSNHGGHFGTIFKWTYPSKKRGKSIQLKCRVL